MREPLGYAQIAPPGFIFVEKLLYETFGRNDAGLRLYSLACGIGALGVAAVISARLQLREGAWLAPLILALGPALIFQSAQLKPYSGDVLFVLGIVAVGLRLGSDPAARRGWPIALGMIAPWFSFPAALTLAAVGAVLLASARRRSLYVVVALWGVATLAAVLYANSLVHPQTADAMQVHWSGGGLGFPPSIAGLVPWTVNQFGALLWSEVGFRGVKFWLGVAFLGGVLLWRRDRVVSGIMLAPILVGLLAAVLRRYPLGDRTSHWVAALLVIAIAVAVTAAIRLLLKMRLPWLAPVPAVLTVAPVALGIAQFRPPYRVDHVKPVFAGVTAAAQPNDRMYVFPGAWHAYRYYQPLLGVSRDHVLLGRCPRRSLREPLRELDSLRGNERVWVLFAHVVTPQGRELLLRYLDTIGVRRQTVNYPTPYVALSSSVDAHLYDLSDSTRLRNSSAETYPVPPDLPNALSQCMLGMVPME